MKKQIAWLLFTVVLLLAGCTAGGKTMGIKKAPLPEGEYIEPLLPEENTKDTTIDTPATPAGSLVAAGTTALTGLTVGDTHFELICPAWDSDAAALVCTAFDEGITRYACQKDACQHIDASCDSYIESNGAIPGLLYAGERLLLYLGTPGSMALHSMAKNGSGRTLLYEGGKADSFIDPASFYTDGKLLYMLESDTEQTASRVLCFDLGTRQMDTVRELGRGEFSILGASENRLVFKAVQINFEATSIVKSMKSRTNTQGGEAAKDAQQAHRIFLLDPASPETELTVLEYGQDEMFTGVYGGTLYSFEADANRFTAINLAKGTSQAVENTIPSVEARQGLFVGSLGSMPLVRITTWETGIESTKQYFIDFEEGEIGLLELNNAGDNRPISVLGQYEDTLLVSQGSYSTNLALLNKTEYLNASPNFRFLDRSRI